MTVTLRTIAVLIAVAAIIDPAFAVRRTPPAVVDVRIGAQAASDERALAIRRQVLGTAAAAVDSPPAPASAPSAVVLIAPSADTVENLPVDLPVSLVRLDQTESGVRIARVMPPPIVLPGQIAVVTADLEAVGLDGQTSVVALEQQGVELARTTLRWIGGSDRQRAELAYAPPVAGVHALRVVVRQSGDDAVVAAAHDVAVVAESRELRVLIYEPRPSWAAAFVRRALEADPVFTPVALARSSRGIDVRAGGPPEQLTTAALASFDAVMVGAPEALSGPEVQAIEAFARGRGGAVVLLPDRRPSGPYARLLPVDGFEEVLTETPQVLEGMQAPNLRATEFALVPDAGRAASVIASLRLRERIRPVIVSWPLGAGQLVFSGALDAWRFRADDDAGFARFWAGVAANLAASAPRALAVTVQPKLVAPGDRVDIRASVRQTEWIGHGARIELPPVSAVVVAADGTQQPIRLWPAAETGVYEGRLVAQAAGQYDVRASAGTLTADAALVVAKDVRTVVLTENERSPLIARATGGVVVDPSDLAPLHEHLRTLAPAPETTTARPMRSAWWIVAFAGALCAEWALRRRRGYR